MKQHLWEFLCPLALLNLLHSLLPPGDFDASGTGLRSAYNPAGFFPLPLHTQMRGHESLLLPAYSESAMLLGQINPVLPEQQQ